MIKIISGLLLVVLFANGANVSATSQNIRSYPLPLEKANVKTNYNIISKDLDIFNIRSEKAGSANNHGNLGDLNSFNLSIGYGFYKYLSLFYDFKYENIDYAGESLKNKKHDIFVKLNIYHNPSAMFNTFSTDLGLIHNSANDLSITGSNLGISKMSDLNDNSFYIRLLVGSKIRSSILDFYLGLKHTSINTKLDSISYERSEVAFNVGFQYTLELGEYLIETGYEYLRLFSRDIDNVKKSNNIFNLTFSRALNEKLLIFIGIKYFSNQYNGIIPYLYNEKTKNGFNQKFGYSTIGFVYNFDLKR